MLLSTLIQELDYEQSAHYRSHVTDFEPEIAHLFRAASDAGVSGIYVFQASPAISQKVVVDRPAVYVAQAEDLVHAKEPRSNNMNLRGRLLRFDGVVPLSVERVSHEIESGQFFIRHFSAGWVGMAIFDRRHAESFLGRGV